MPKFLQFSITFLLLSPIVFSQDKLVVDDQAGLISGEVEALVCEKLAAEGITYTHDVDYKVRCQYYYLEVVKKGVDVVIRVTDCANTQLGSRNLGSRILSSPDQEKSLLLTYAIMDIASRPGQYSESAEAAVSKEQEEMVPVAGDSRLTNEHDSRYFFAPSAYNLKKGELYYNAVYFLIHDIQYGLENNLSIGMGTTVIGLPIYITPKVSIPIGEKSAIAIGDMLLLGTWGTNAIGNLAYGTFSTGGPDGNISVGAGHLATNENNITGKSSSLVTNFSFMGRISPYIFMLSENYVMSANFNRYASFYGANDYTEETFVQRNSFWYGIAGVRIISKSRDFISWQIGLTYIVNFPGDYPVQYSSPHWNHNARDEMNMIAFPTVSFTVKFGKRF